MKKTLVTAGLAVLGAAAFAFAGCDNGTSALASAQDVYGMGAVSTVRLLGCELSGSAVKSLSAVKIADVASESETEEEGAVKEQAEKFNEYFTMLDSFLGEEVVTTKAVRNTDEQYAQYEIKLTITGKDLLGETETYLMYYTETLHKAKTEDDETEEEYTLEGVMVLDGEDYALRGERSYEEERGETENDLKIRAYPDPEDKDTYVQMKQENSVEKNETETEYVYSVVRDGKLIEETAVEFETEQKDNKEEIKYELEFRSGDAKGSYKLEKETKDGAVQIKVKYNIDGSSGTFRIRETENGYEYSFSDNSKKLFKK